MFYDYKYHLSEPSLGRTFAYKTLASAGSSSFMHITPLSSISTALPSKHSLKVLKKAVYYLFKKLLKIVFVIA